MSLIVLALGIAVLLALRVPVAFSFLGPSLVYMLLHGNSIGFSLRIITDGVNSFPLLAVPLFIFMGVVANKLGVTERLFEFALAALSRVRGNLAYVNIGTSFGFAWMSGSALADAAGLGKVQIPALLKAGYPFRFSAGLTASTALISPVMPPSIVAVLYASAAAVSTGAFFAASIFPALLITLAITIYVAIWIRRQDGLTTIPFNGRRLAKATLGVIAPTFIPVVILGGILGGIFTPTEAAAVGATFVLILGVCYRTISFRIVWNAIMETVTITASIMIIIAGAKLLGWIMAREQLPRNAGDLLLSISENPIVFLLLINLLLILLGTVIDASAVIVVAAPVLVPIAVQFGVDPIHFGVLMIVNLMIGLLTPPVGSVVYVISTIAQRPIEEVFKGVFPFLIPFGVVLLLVTFIPDIAMTLPRLLGLA